MPAATSAPKLVDSQYVPYIGEDLALSRIDVTTLGDLLLKAYDQFPNKPALIFPDSNWTYSELVARAMRTARGLQAIGVKPGDNVGLLLPTGTDLVETFFAIAFCGATAVLINARYRAAELAYVIENSNAVTVVTTDTIAEQVDFTQRLTAAFTDLSSQSDALHLKIGAAPKLSLILR